MIALLTLPANVMAQVPKERAHAGIRASFDLTTSTTARELTSFGPGVSVGGAYYAPFGKYTYLNIGVLFSYDTFGFKGSVGDIVKRHYDGRIEIIGMRLPIDFGFKFYQTDKVRLSVYAGPHSYINFSVKDNITVLRHGEYEKFDGQISHPGLDIGIGLGLAADLFRHWHIHVDATYGLSNLGRSTKLWLADYAPYYKRLEVSVGLGYNF